MRARDRLVGPGVAAVLVELGTQLFQDDAALEVEAAGLQAGRRDDVGQGRQSGGQSVGVNGGRELHMIAPGARVEAAARRLESLAERHRIGEMLAAPEEHVFEQVPQARQGGRVVPRAAAHRQTEAGRVQVGGVHCHHLQAAGEA